MRPPPADTSMAPSSTTLVSLAILKVDLDEGVRDYMGYFEYFFINLLQKHRPDPIVVADIAALFTAEYGLKVPEKGAQLVLRRLARRGHLKRQDNRYHIVGDLPAADFEKKKVLAERQIHDVYEKLKTYAKTNYRVDWNDTDVERAILGFLSRFAVECIKAFVYSTALPESPTINSREQFIVSKFIRHLYDLRDSTFENVIVLIKGQMYANALICPDLESIEKTFKRVTFYIDTPVVLGALGMQAKADADATRELLDLLVRLKGTLAVFEHIVGEIDSVLEFAELNLDRTDATGRVIKHLRDRGIRRGDIALYRGNLEEHLKNAGFAIRRTPKYNEEYQINEADLEKTLRDELSYRSTRGAEHDTNSVRSIFALRQDSVPRRLEDCNAVLVTDNAKFAQIAFQHGKEQNSAKEVSTVITDYSLANIAWLKAPLGAPDLPEKEVIAACYVALEPGKPLWDKYIAEIESLQEQGDITADDHAVLRVSGIATNELMELTLGDERAFGADSVPQIVSRVRATLVAEQLEAVAVARKSRDIESERRREFETQIQRSEKKLYWLSDKCATAAAALLSLLGLAVISCAAFGSAVLTVPWVKGSLLGTSVAHGAILSGSLWMIASACYGIQMRSLIGSFKHTIHIGIFKKLSAWLLDKRDERASPYLK